MTGKIRRAETSANVLMLQELWKGAFDSTKGIRIICKDGAEAFKLRTKLYNAVRNAKKFPGEYPELEEAVQEVEIVFEGEWKEVLVMRQKSLSPLMVNLRKQLEAQGIVIADSALRGTPQTREIAASMDRLLGQLQEPAGSGREATSANSATSANLTPSTTVATVASSTNLEQGNPPPPPLPGGHNPFFSRG